MSDSTDQASQLTKSGVQVAPPAPRAQRGAGRGGAAAYRLDKRTYLDKEQGRYKIILRDYGGGLCEVGWSFVPNLLPTKAGRGNSEQRQQHEDRAVRRARSRLRQLILSAQADHLLTLTYRENVTDYKQASNDLSAFIRLVRTYLPKWVFITVPERQKRGAWHWHLAVVGRQDVDLLRRCWRHVVDEGNIDVQKPRRGKNRRLGIVAYLSKYLAKGFAENDRELNGHRYRASLGIQVPGELVEIPEHLRGEVSAYVLAQLRERAGHVGFVWVDTHIMAGWACSWG
ncbi:MAG: hypothetical protein EPO47_08625 [Rugosibacter sp.]|nr:MAG: hypothetical protein EPO47_08625 [Rugosibacter sp.]